MDAALKDIPTWTLSESMKAEEEEETAAVEVLADQSGPKGLLNTANDCYCNRCASSSKSQPTSLNGVFI